MLSSSLFGHQINLPSRHGPSRSISSLDRFVPFSLLQALLGARSCYRHSFCLPSLTLFFSIVVPYYILHTPFTQCCCLSIVASSNHPRIFLSLDKLLFDASRLLLEDPENNLRKRTCKYIGYLQHSRPDYHFVDVRGTGEAVVGPLGRLLNRTSCCAYVSPLG